MTRWIVLLAMLSWTAATASAQEKEKQTEKPVFRPPVVLAAAEAPYPHRSIAYGTVVAEVTISASGEVEEVRVLRDIPSLSEVAVASARKWKFAPATLDGKPIRSTMALAFTFTPPVIY